MTLSQVASEDPRFLEREAPPLSEEFPEGSKIFFLGEHAYGVAAQVSATTDSTLSVILAVSAQECIDVLRLRAFLVLPVRQG
jgi:5'-3' exoribonuclease 1